LIGDLAFNAAEEAQEGIAGQDVVEVAVRQQEDALLLLVDVIDLD
jgi:hypothetical protein